MIAVNSWSLLAKSTDMAVSSVVTIMSWANRIHPRRRPSRSEATVSTMGPAAHLNAHGR